MINLLIAIVVIWIVGFIILAIIGAIAEEISGSFSMFNKDEPYIMTPKREDHTNWID